jgi:hypothetical protein
MGINYKGSQGHTERAVVLQEEEVMACNGQKVLQQGYVKILCQLSWKLFPVCTYQIFLVVIVVVSKLFSVTGKAHHSILPLKVGVVVTNHGKTSNILMIQVGFTLFLVVSLIVAVNMIFMYKAFCDV